MQAKEIAAYLERTAMPILERHGFEFIDAEFVKEGTTWYMRLYIDKEGGIGIDECALVSRELDEQLDDNITEQQYMLEVSSPGLDRLLKRDHEYTKYKGRLVDVKLYKALDGSKEFRGELAGLNADDTVTIILENGDEMSFARKDIASTRLAVIF
jgi:ribosome maturation factor RimP